MATKLMARLVARNKSERNNVTPSRLLRALTVLFMNPPSAPPVEGNRRLVALDLFPSWEGSRGGSVRTMGKCAFMLPQPDNERGQRKQNHVDQLDLERNAKQNACEKLLNP